MEAMPPSPSGTTARASEQHYSIYAPGTPPLGRENDVPLLTQLAEFAESEDNPDGRQSLDLILRIAKPSDHFANPGRVPFWRRLRFYPDRATALQTGALKTTFTGIGRDLGEGGTEGDTQYDCTVTLQVEDRPVGSWIGELTLTQQGGTR